jgi:hypothetical protein
MVTMSSLLSLIELRRFRSCPVDCPKLTDKISSLAQYFAVISSAVTANTPFWFRGHSEPHYSLTPSALRYRTAAKRSQALQLISEFMWHKWGKEPSGRIVGKQEVIREESANRQGQISRRLAVC